MCKGRCTYSSIWLNDTIGVNLIGAKGQNGGIGKVVIKYLSSKYLKYVMEHRDYPLTHPLRMILLKSKNNKNNNKNNCTSSERRVERHSIMKIGTCVCILPEWRRMFGNFHARNPFR